MFDFCLGLNIKELEIIKNKLKKLYPKTIKQNVINQLDLLKVLAYELEFYYEEKVNTIDENLKNESEYIASFIYKKIDTLQIPSYA